MHEGHHSKSVLVAPARLRLGTVYPTIMPSTPWKCGYCQMKCKGTAVYCPQCGGHWQDIATPAGTEQRQPPWPDASWQDGWDAWPNSDQRPWSSRPPPSPRGSPRATQAPKGGKGKGNGNGKQGGHSSGKGKDKGNGKGKGKGGKADQQPPRPAPALANLPKAPPTPPVAHPKGQASSASSPPTEERKVLQALAPLIGQLEGLPQALRDQISSITDSEHRQESRELHALVRRRTTARTALTRIHTERAQFEQSWAVYMEQLQQLLQKQFKQRTDTLEDYLKAEAEWRISLQEATTALQSIEEDAKRTVIVDSDMDAEELPPIDSQVTAPNVDEIKAGQQNLLSALMTVQASAMQGAKRDGSRTPRRGKKEGDSGDHNSSSSPDPWKDKASGLETAAAQPSEVSKAASKAMQPFGKPQT